MVTSRKTLKDGPPANGGNVTGMTQNVVVGQQVLLSTNISIPSGLAVSSNQWTIAGTVVGGYRASTSSGSVVMPILTNRSATIYWAYPAQGLSVKYSYCMNNGQCSPTVTTTFNVSGPSGGTMVSSALSQVYIANLSFCSSGRPAGPYLVYALGATGNACSWMVTTPGIIFNSPTGYSNTSGGGFIQAQLISHDTLTGGGTTYGPGLDTSWPGWTVPFPHNDNPNIYLAPTYTTLTRSFQATSFLMWQSSTSGSIPVPLGYQTWQFSATASCSASCGSASNWRVTSSSGGLVGGFTPSNPSQTSVGQNTLTYGYPTWSSVSF